MVKSWLAKSLILSTIVCSIFHFSCSPRVVDDQRVALEREVWDFGTLKRGEIAKTKVRLINFSSAGLKFSLYSTCDCLEARADSDSLIGHGSVEISLSYTGDEIKEKVTKTLYADVFNGLSERLVLTVTGKVVPGDKPHLFVSPNPVPIEPGSGSAYLQVSNRGLEELAIYDIKGFGCTTDLRSLHLNSGETIEIRLSLVEAWKGNRWIEIESNDAVYPLKKVSVMVLR
ncbi:MAG: hypothetical protein ACUVUU_04760 [bacterium]